MSPVQQMIAYFCLNYPHPDELSKARLTKLIYLADWFSALTRKRQMTGIHWLFNHYGPYVSDVILAAENSSCFNLRSEENYYGSSKTIFEFKGDPEDIRLDAEERRILDAVIEKTCRLYYNDFISYVYSTYPVRANERYSSLNLVSLADEFRSMSLEREVLRAE